MSFSSIILLLLAFGYPLYLLLSSYHRERRFQAFARANGCQPPHNDDTAWPWGIDRMYSILTARRKGLDPLDDCFAPPLFKHPTLEHSGLGGVRMMETIDPENVKTILSTNFKDWEIGQRRHDAFIPAIGKNVFTSDGPFWEHSRAMLRPQFSREKINDLVGMERELETLYEAIEARGVGKDCWTQELDLLPLLFRFVLDNATSFTFGEAVGAQDAFLNKGKERPSEEAAKISKIAAGDRFAEAFDIGSYWMVVRIRLQQLAFLGTSKEFREACETMRKLPDYYAQRALSGQQKHDLDKFDLLSTLAGNSLSPAELRDQALGLLVAGRDTTSGLLAWTILMLGQNPEVFQKLCQVVADTFPPSESSTLDFSQLKGCRYLQHVFQETLRLYSIVPLNSRVALRDTVLPVGGGPNGSKPIAVRKGQQVLWNIYAMHRRQDLWGDDVMEFKPERWEDSRRSRLLGGGWAFLPFSGGPRICLGQQFALTEASYCLVRLLQRYDDLELVPDSAAAKGERIQKTIGISLAPLEVRVRLHKAAT